MAIRGGSSNPSRKQDWRPRSPPRLPTGIVRRLAVATILRIITKTMTMSLEKRNITWSRWSTVDRSSTRYLIGGSNPGSVRCHCHRTRYVHQADPCWSEAAQLLKSGTAFDVPLCHVEIKVGAIASQLHALGLCYYRLNGRISHISTQNGMIRNSLRTKLARASRRC